MKKFTLFVVALLVAMLAVVPAFAQDRDYDAIDPAALEGVEVDFWYQHSSFRAVQLEAMIAVFNNPDVNVEEFLATQDAELEEAEVARVGEIIEGLRDVAREYNPYGIVVNGSFQGGYGEIFEKMLLGIEAGELPELVVAYQNQAATYELDDAILDMTPLVTSETWGLAEDEVDDFFQGFYSADVFPTFDGARLGFPPNRSMEVMYFNQDWLAELEAAGAISFSGAPQTPEQFREAACAAVNNPFSAAAGEAAPLGYQLSVDASRYASWTFAFGGDIFDYEAGEYDLDSEAAVEAMTFLQGLFADGCAGFITERFGDQAAFGRGELLFTVGSSSGLPFYGLAVNGAYEDVDAEPFTWNVGPVPYVTEAPQQNIYGASVSIVESTPEEELATWIFIKYYTDARVQRYWAEASNYFPVRESVAGELDASGYFEANPAYQSAFNLLEFGRTEPPVPGYDFVRTDMEETMAFLMENTDEDVAAALAELNVRANENLTELTGGM